MKSKEPMSQTEEAKTEIDTKKKEEKSNPSKEEKSNPPPCMKCIPLSFHVRNFSSSADRDQSGTAETSTDIVRSSQIGSPSYSQKEEVLSM